MKLRAFTLIELLIVVAIIGILAAIAVPNFLGAQMRARVSRAVADERNLSVALESYKLDNNRYPPASLENRTTRVTVYARWAKLTTPIAYIASVPEDPFFDRPEVDIPTIRGGPVYGLFERESSNLTTAPWGPDPREQNALYFIHTYGPNGKNDAVTINGYYTFIRYDMSNGITSNGNIVRYGP